MKKAMVSIFSLAIVLSLSHPAAGQAGSSSLNDQLIKAAGNGDTAAVRQMLEKGANIEAKDDKGYTALITAAYLGNTEVVKLLLAKGANIDAMNDEGSTALIKAVFSGFLSGSNEVVKLLLTKGANVEVRDKRGYTALDEARQLPNDEAVTLLKEHGAH
jgi:ankyrin repeat protein